MSRELAIRNGKAMKMAGVKGALKKAAKKGALKKAAAKKSAAKKAPGKKAPGKKGTKSGSGDSLQNTGGGQSRAFHSLRRAAALISLLERASGDDLRTLLDQGAAAYRRSAWIEATGLLQAAEHLGMAGLYAARSEHRVNVHEPAPDEVYRRIDRVAVQLDSLGERAGEGQRGRLHAVATELLKRAEAADHDLHLAWELVGAAEGICTALEGTRG